MTIHLPDVSEFQGGSINWGAVKQRNGGAAVIRVSYGTSHPDQHWPHNRTSAEAAGIAALGFYQYIVAGQDAVAQAATFCAMTGHLKPGQFAVADLEEGGGDQSARAHAWLDHVDAHLPAYSGYQGAWLYSGSSFAVSTGLGPIFSSPRHTWVAAYPFTYPSPEPGLPHSLWQHSNGTIGRCEYEPWPGIGACDCSVFDGTLGDLLDRIGRQSAPKPDPKPAPPPAPAPAPPEDDMPELDTNIASHPLLLPFGTKTMDLLSVAPEATPCVVSVTFLGDAGGAKEYSLSWGAAGAEASIPVPSGVKKARLDVVSGGGLPVSVRYNQ